jgi:hypothetical protein
MLCPTELAEFTGGRNSRMIPEGGIHVAVDRYDAFLWRRNLANRLGDRHAASCEFIDPPRTTRLLVLEA